MGRDAALTRDECRTLTGPNMLTARTCSGPRTATSVHRHRLRRASPPRLASRLRVRHQGVVAASWRLAQAFDLMEGLTCQSGSRSRQTEHGILRTEGLRAASRDVRAAKAAAGQDGFCATWPIEISWGAMSGSYVRRCRGAIGRHLATPGAPSTAAERPARARALPTPGPGAGKGLKQVSDR